MPFFQRFQRGSWSGWGVGRQFGGGIGGAVVVVVVCVCVCVCVWFNGIPSLQGFQSSAAGQLDPLIHHHVHSLTTTGALLEDALQRCRDDREEKGGQL